jgi:hypothetical protein
MTSAAKKPVKKQRRAETWKTAYTLASAKIIREASQLHCDRLPAGFLCVEHRRRLTALVLKKL